MHVCQEAVCTGGMMEGKKERTGEIEPAVRKVTQAATL